MKKIFAFMACAAMVCGCTKQQPAPAARTIVTVGIDDSFKTVLGENTEGKRPVYWEDGDQLCLNAVVSRPLTDIPARSKSATFVFDDVISAPFKAIYPASLWNGGESVKLPLSAQNGILPLSAHNQQSMSLTLSPVTGAIGISIKKSTGEKPDTHDIKYVEVSSTTAQLSGTFTYDYTTNTLTGAESPAGDDRLVRVFLNKPLPESGAEKVIIPLPAGTYAFSVKVVDVSGHFMKKDTSSEKTITRGTISSLPEFEFVPTGTQFDVVIEDQTK